MHFSCQSWQRGRWPASLSAALAVLLSDAIELKFMTKPLTKLPPVGDCAAAAASQSTVWPFCQSVPDRVRRRRRCRRDLTRSHAKLCPFYGQRSCKGNWAADRVWSRLRSAMWSRQRLWDILEGKLQGRRQSRRQSKWWSMRQEGRQAGRQSRRRARRQAGWLSIRQSRKQSDAQTATAASTLSRRKLCNINRWTKRFKRRLQLALCGNKKETLMRLTRLMLLPAAPSASTTTFPAVP